MAQLTQDTNVVKTYKIIMPNITIEPQLQKQDNLTLNNIIFDTTNKESNLESFGNINIKSDSPTIQFIDQQGNVGSIKLDVSKFISSINMQLPNVILQSPQPFLRFVDTSNGQQFMIQFADGQIYLEGTLKVDRLLVGQMSLEQANNVLKISNSLGNPCPIWCGEIISPTIQTILETSVEVQAKVARHEIAISEIQQQQTDQDYTINAIQSNLSQHTTFILALQTSQSQQDLRLNGLESKNVQQDTRLDSIETKNTQQDEKIQTNTDNLYIAEMQINLINPSPLKDNFGRLDNVDVGLQQQINNLLNEITNIKNQYQRVPIGTIISNIQNVSQILQNGQVFLRCDGAVYNTTTYASFYGIYGSNTLPNLSNALLRYGTEAQVKTIYGTDDISLNIQNLPAHRHNILYTSQASSSSRLWGTNYNDSQFGAPQGQSGMAYTDFTGQDVPYPHTPRSYGVVYFICVQ